MHRKPLISVWKSLALACVLGASAAQATPWSFGVMSDTQWPNSPDGKNPNVALNIVRHLNQEFIKHGVKFVIQVGDLTDTGGANNINLDVRATFAQDLYNHGIGFYPLRGNHESSASNAVRVQQIFPQTQTGVNNQTPNMVATTIYGDLTDRLLYPDYNDSVFVVGSNFVSEPTYEGLTYSFDYENARFVLIDQFNKPSGTPHSNLDAADVAWVGGRLSDPNRPSHAFTFAHKHLISENHNDNLFGSNPTVNQTAKDLMKTFVQYLATNGVRYHVGGHDHMHNRAVVSNPSASDGTLAGTYQVQNLVTASDSYKFYIPPTAGTLATQPWRSLEKQIAQELFTVGYYIFTVDGPKVTVDYYAMPNGCNGDCDQTYDVIPYAGNTPTIGYPYANPTVFFDQPVPFTKHETFGYSLNGIEKVVEQGGDYALTDDTAGAVASGERGYLGTAAQILGGFNGSAGKDYSGRLLAKTVDTGWAPAGDAPLASDILTLWGMADSLATDFGDADNPNMHYAYTVPNTYQTDAYALSMTYHDERLNGLHLGNGGFRLAAKDANGNWVKAVDLNVGGKKKFVKGPWKPGYALGTYGVDTDTHTVWAVVNYNGDFAAATDLD